MAIILGILIVVKESVLEKHIFKKSAILMLFICAILNFQILDEGLTGNIIDEKGGYLGYGLLRVSDIIFGSQISAIKIFFTTLTIGMTLWIIYSINIGIKPVKVQFNLKSNDGEPSRQKPIVLKEKAAQDDAKAIKSLILEATTKNRNQINNNHNQNKDNEQIASDKLNKNIIKTLLKDKFAKKFEEKSGNIESKKIQFTPGIPTFNTNLLDDPEDASDYDIDEEFLAKNARSIQEKLEEFGISVSLDGFNIGPSVIQIKITPEAGVKVTKIEGLKKDLSLALKTKSLRVLAPIPGTGTVGIEIPNPKPRIVRLKEVLGSKEFSINMGKNVTNLSIGIGIDGGISIKSLEKMPHLLIAGATGSGKSVGVNDCILSLMYQNTPADLKFIMVDPKQVELGMYEGLPYLLSPIITEPCKALKVLKRAAMHMDERYAKLKKFKVRNIEEYNEKQENDDDKMYRIVIIIDELADLMMSGNKKENELTITRIAQKARAVGMHLILATQRPSVNVVTGLIKANVPTRIAFGVAQQVDSRTILDQKGAEDLVGKGDLLYIDPNNKFPVRIQSPYVDTLETEKVVSYLKEKYMKGINEEDIYHPEIVNILTAKPETAGGNDSTNGDDEELVQKATDIILESRKASATLFQRKLGIGFARASRIMDILEDRGIVGPQDGAKPREILI
ncbi:MAG: DNA translocase FtsK [Candidatus Absconditabacteria bacterium]